MSYEEIHNVDDIYSDNYYRIKCIHNNKSCFRIKCHWYCHKGVSKLNWVQYILDRPKLIKR